jgi:small-conductance mechanosensitive channel
VGPFELWQAIGLALALVVAAALGKLAQALVLRVGARIAKATATAWDDSLLTSLDGPFWLFTAVLAARALIAPLRLQESAERVADVVVHSSSLIAVIWFVQRLVRILMVGLTTKAPRGSSDRALRTHVEVTGRIIQAGTWLVGGSVFLLQFEVVRSVGVSLLASAGIVGVVLGVAAQKSFAQLFAGVQLSITQPVRLGDLVSVQGQFGEVEEIRLTYVVVRTWDLRRLVVPISAFLDQTFENWSLGSLDLMASVQLKLDFCADLDELRKELSRVLMESPNKELHDGKSSAAWVTDSDERTITVRAAASVSGATKAFELQCRLREALIAFIQARPRWLPRGRSEAPLVLDVNGGPKPSAPRP